MIGAARVFFQFLGIVLCLQAFAGCASVADPRRADIFSYDREKSQKFIDERQADLDALQQRRAQLDLEKKNAQGENEAKERERDVLSAKLSELDRSMEVMESRLASLKASSSKLKARRKEMQSRVKALKGEIAECQRQVQGNPEATNLRKRLEGLLHKQRQLEEEYSVLSESSR